MGIRVQDVERLHAGLLVAALCVALATGWLSAPSLLLGGAVMAANVWILRQLAARLLTAGADRRRRPGIVVALLLAKFTIFMGLLGLLFWRVPVDALAFAVGATLLLVACVIAALRAPRLAPA
jgi:hypothetical protein